MQMILVKNRLVGVILDRKTIAIIPARSGSKGIKDKNIKDLKGKPLIAYSIEEALKSGIFEDVVVSTDSDIYAEISKKYGAWVPFLRSKNLSQDTSTTTDVIQEVILMLKSIGKEYDNLMILQPTSPLRDKEDIIGAFDLFNKKKANCVVSMCECDHSPLLTKCLDDNQCLDGFLSTLSKVRRQELPKYYRLNGAIYLMKIEYFLKYRDFYREDSYAFIMNKNKSIDIDSIEDFQYADFLMKKSLD
jgi:CMP-N,N'-diacetyllegionaminic acid synthase